MSSTRVERAAIGPGVSLSVQLPGNAQEEIESALPVLDVSGLAGASVTLRRGWSDGQGLVLRAGCVRGPSDRWAPGVEELVLARAAGIAQRSVPGDFARWNAGPIEAKGGLFEQRLHGEGGARGEGAVAEGRLLLGFAGESRDAVLCSLVCAEPAARVGGGRCAELVRGAAPEGAFTGAPPPSMLVRGILLAAERPKHAALVASVLGAAVVAVILARRPRPRP